MKRFAATCVVFTALAANEPCIADPTDHPDHQGDFGNGSAAGTTTGSQAPAGQKKREKAKKAPSKGSKDQQESPIQGGENQ